MQQLIDYLNSLQGGEISNIDRLEPMLATYWDEFSGSNEEGMLAHKLHGRMEKTTWHPPILAFVIERHGATVMGSTIASLYRWEVDTENKSASCFPVGFRQVASRQPPLDVRPVAEEIARLIVGREQDERLKWNKGGSVRVHVGKILPAGSAVRQTLDGRRERFRQAVEDLVSEAGWRKIRANVYAPPDSDTARKGSP